MGTVGETTKVSRMNFTTRLMWAVAVTILLAGLGQYAFGYAQMRGTASDRILTSYRADGKVLVDLVADAAGEPGEAVGELLSHIQHRPGVQAVALVAADGTLTVPSSTHAGPHDHDDVAAHDDAAAHADAAGHHAPVTHEGAAGHDDAADHGDVTPDEQAVLRAELLALAGTTLGQGHASVVDLQGGGIGFSVPVAFPDGSQALVVATDGAALGENLADLRLILLVGFVLSLVVGLPAFHVLGGRRLAADHASNVDRAVRDGLTGLANHRSFHETIRAHLAASARHGQPVVLALFDLDGFKFVNDTAGHRRGDEVLAEVGEILAAGRSGDLPFRVGGDEFALILPNTDIDGARVACERIRDVIDRRLPEIGVSVGIAAFDADGDDAETLWANADAAMYQAKRQGKNRVVAACELDVSDPSVALPAAAALRALIDAGHLDVVFQPIFDLGGAEVLGYEALVRPPAVTGFGGPYEMFIAAERLHLVPELDAVCRRSILAAASDLPEGAQLFLNVSPGALDHELLDWDGLATQTVAAGLSPAQVVIELTERTSLPAQVLGRAVEDIRSAGFQVALDDIGTGWAGFASLLSLRPDVAKIDRGIVVAAAEDPHAAAVLVAVATYSALTGTRVIAEGVETSDVLDYLRGVHGDLITGVQGFLLGRPSALPAREVAAGAPGATVGPSSR